MGLIWGKPADPGATKKRKSPLSPQKGPRDQSGQQPRGIEFVNGIPHLTLYTARFDYEAPTF